MRIVLIVESHPSVAESLAYIVAQGGSRVVVAQNGPSSIVHLAEHPVDLVILGDPLPGMSALDVLRTLQRETRGRTPIAMLSTTESWRDAAMAFDASAFFSHDQVSELVVFLMRIDDAAMPFASRPMSCDADR